MKKEILIVVVVYNKKIIDLEIIRYAIKNRYNIFVYDNSKVNQIAPAGIIYIHDKENAGVSKAYNEGIKLAKQMRKKYVLLLDQDTRFNLSILNKYFELENKYGDNYIYASIMEKGEKIYSPFIEKNFRGKIQKRDNFLYTEKYNLNNKSIINSGMMIPLNIIDKIGWFNEKIKLDFSDIFFVEKYKKLNNEIILVENYVEHSLSGDEGKDKKREYTRFKFYCNGAKELYRSLKKKGVLLTVFLRTGKLCVKYIDMKPVLIYIKYFWRDEKI